LGRQAPEGRNIGSFGKYFASVYSGVTAEVWRVMLRRMASVASLSTRCLMVVRLCAALIGAGLIAACGSSLASPSAVVSTARSGSVQISFLSATPPPGSTISGCGADPRGCRGRLTMTFRLKPGVTGHLDSGAVYLFDANGRDGCIGMNISPTDLVVGADAVIVVRADIANEFCPMPLVVDRMVFTIYGETALRSQQSFRIGYAFIT
jgi:hypothetical protein